MEPETSTTAPAKPPRKWLFLLIILAAAALSFVVTTGFEDGTVQALYRHLVSPVHSHYPPVVLLDENQVFRTVTEKELSAQSVTALSSSISSAIDGAVTRYTEHGSVVLLTAKVAIVPARDNITPQIIQEVLHGTHQPAAS